MKRNFIPAIIWMGLLLCWYEVVCGATPGLVRVKDGSGSGSGVCISPDGWVLTCRHVVVEGDVPRQNLSVVFEGGQEMPATIAVKGKTRSADLAILKVEGGGLPYTPLSMCGPSEGDAVSIEGYPGRNYSHTDCRVVRVNVESQRTGEQESLVLDCRAQSGHSGGPVLSSVGEVCGIVYAIPVNNPELTIIGGIAPSNDRFETYAMGHTALRKITEAAKQKGHHIATVAVRPGSYRPKSPLKPRMVVLVGPNCSACVKFKTDAKNPELAAALQAAYRVEILSERRSVGVAKRYGVTMYPAFLLSNANRIIQGYEGARWLEQQISAAVDGSPHDVQQKVDFDYQLDGEDDQLSQQKPQQQFSGAPQGGPQSPPPLSVEEPEASPVSTEKNPDTGGVRVIVTVAKHSLSFLLGKVVTSAERWVSGQFSQAIQEQVKGCIVVPVFERLEPSKFAAVNRAAKIDGGNMLDVIVLAPERFKGSSDFLSGAISRAINQSPLRNLGDFHSIHVVLQRFRADDFATISSAMKTVESGDDDGSGWAIVGAGGVGGAWALLNFLKNKKLIAMLKRQEAT